MVLPGRFRRFVACVWHAARDAQGTIFCIFSLVSSFYLFLWHIRLVERERMLRPVRTVLSRGGS
jgi:hypothetical protein